METNCFSCRYLFVIMLDSGVSSIQRLDLSGSARRTLLISGTPSALALDYDNELVYWLENEANSTCTVKSCDYNGDRVTRVADKIPQCRSEGMDFASVIQQFILKGFQIVADFN